MVFSQQHGVLRKLVDDGARLEQEYLVEVVGDLAAGGLERLRHGLAYQGRRLSPCKVSWQNESHLRFALKDVLPGQLRCMCESEGLEVRSIRRLRIGAVAGQATARRMALPRPPRTLLSAHSRPRRARPGDCPQTRRYMAMNALSLA